MRLAAGEDTAATCFRLLLAAVCHLSWTSHLSEPRFPQPGASLCATKSELIGSPAWRSLRGAEEEGQVEEETELLGPQAR